MTDRERLDFLETLLTRTEFQNSRRPSVAVTSDMHFNEGSCCLYVRNLFGNPIKGGMNCGNTVRDAIDAAAAGVYP